MCRARGFTGTQGVLLPASNVPNLMLDDEVLEAVRAGQFHVWSAQKVDEALELLAGVAADSIHGNVRARLDEFAAAVKSEEPETAKTAVQG